MTTMMARPGEISILNCTTGDTKISFDSNNPAEVERAKAVVEDMLRRGYCLSIVVGDRMERAVGFDAATNEYIVDSPATPAAPEPAGETSNTTARRGGRKKGTPNRRRLPAAGHAVVAVGQTAGGGLGCRHFPMGLDELRSSRSKGAQV